MDGEARRRARAGLARRRRLDGALLDELEPALRDALAVAAGRLRDFNELQVDTRPRGEARLCLRPEPLRRAGCYVPGGRAAYPSTVLMSVIPAQVAGVESIAVTTPATPDGRIHPVIAAAAHLLGVDEVHAIGGAQAIAALAYGTESVAAVDKVVGPGNLFVTLAKREVFGAVDIDQLAGPSEILVVASGDADPEAIAADLVSQLEHDPLAWAVCITDSTALAEAVRAAFDARGAGRRAGGDHRQLRGAPRRGGDRRRPGRRAGDGAPRSHPSTSPSRGAPPRRCATASAARAPCSAATLSPVSMGDYIAGPNHTLPTQGAARYRGGLSVMDFVRWPSVVDLTGEEFDRLAPVARGAGHRRGAARPRAGDPAARGGTRVMSERRAQTLRETKETRIECTVLDRRPRPRRASTCPSPSSRT